jgi:hypothetical protein
MASEEKRRIDWTDNLTEKLVDLLQMRECLWKVKEPIYSDRNARQKALAEMSAEPPLRTICRQNDFGTLSSNSLKSR